MAESANPGIRPMVLAAYSVRRRVVRGADGSVSLLWGALGVRVTYEEFLDLAKVLRDATECEARYGELARGVSGRVVRCSMGQVALHHGNLTLWFSPEEFEGFRGLVAAARSRLADAAPVPRLGIAWRPREESPHPN